ncbi:MAG: HmuY family protein, partial [Gemmatimonadota bacterium]
MSDPATSNEWDLSLFATTVTLNGGAAGSGGVSGFCVCARATATDDAIRALTPAATLSDFEALVATSIPGDDAFRSDQLSPAISGWLNGSGTSSTVALDRAWILRKGTTSATLGKFRVLSVQQNSATNAGQITFEYATQASPGAAFSASHSRTVDVRNGPVYFDLTSGAVSSSANWDLRFEGYQIR